MSPYAQAQLDPIQRGVGSLSSAMVMAPRIRAMAAQIQARQQQEQAMATEAIARTGLINTQTQRGQMQLSQALALANRLKQPGAITQDKDGNVIIDKDALADVTSALGGMAKDSNDAAGSLSTIFKSVNAPVQANLDRSNKASIAAAADAERAARPVVVGNGATLMAPTGQPLGSGGVTLNQGQQRFAPAGLVAPTPNVTDGADTSLPPTSLPSALSQAVIQAQAGAQDAPAIQPQPSGPQQPIAAVPPKPATPAQVPPSVQSQAFKQALLNSDGGTNLAQAFQALQKYVPAMATAPAANAPVAQSAQSLPTINTQEDYDALPSGAQYKDSAGNLAVKRGK